jgi:hypothetical protein
LEELVVLREERHEERIERVEAEKLVVSTYLEEVKDALTLELSNGKTTTTRATLRCVQGSMLERMFAPENVATLTIDDGAIFLDRFSSEFSQLLNYLRYVRVSKTRRELMRHALPPVSTALAREMEYFAMNTALFNKK